jgi:hypothetical protein
VAIKNGQSIETDNCIATFIYILSFTVTIFMYQAQLINTEILSYKIKRNNKYSVFINWAWYINIVTVNEKIYIKVAMQLSVSIDCPFLIATFSSIYANLLYD